MAIKLIAGLALFALLTTPVRAAKRQMLPGHVPAAVAKFNLQPVGRLPATNRLDLLIGLPLRNRGTFSNLLAQLYNPASSQFHRWLKPNQIAQQFGPTERDYQAVIAWTKTNGLTVTTTHADHTLLRVQGSVADIEKAFDIKMQVYQHPTEARTFYAPDVEPSVDLSIPLLHITGLDNFNIPHHRRLERVPPIPADAGFQGSGPSSSYWGNDFRTLYVPGTSLTGSGQILGVLEDDDYYSNDIASYISQSGFSTSVQVARIPIDGGVSGPSTDNDEISLDIEVAIAMAPGLTAVRVYEAAPNSDTFFVDILKQMQEDDLANQLSSSFSLQANDPNDPNADAIYQLFGSQGQSFFQSAGDHGAYHPGVGDFADDPYETIVGGTVPTNSSAGGPWAGESAWNQGGGGISASYLGNYAIPSWQQGVSMSLNGGSYTMRNVPDVSMVAYSFYAIYDNGSNQILQGTSGATPLWAGFTALVNQQAAASGQPTVGFLNPALYTIGEGPNYTNCFHDITSGADYANDNGQSISNNAVVGYDLCTGWGTPNGTNLINALMPYAGAVWVDFNYTGTNQNGSYIAPFSTLAQGVAAVSNKGNIWIRTAGSSPETLTISKPMSIRAANGAATIGQ